MPGPSQFALFRTRRFLPLFIAQAIGAFNDNAFRGSLAILFFYGATRPGNPEGTNALAAGLLVIPFFLFSALAGQLADKFDKAVMARRIKFVEIGLIALASYSLFSGQVWLQLFCVFLTGTQSAFFGPIKYAVLPQYLTKEELLGGNGMVEMGTFLAVLGGTIFGSLFILGGAGLHVVSGAMIALAICAYAAAWFMPPAPPAQADLKINFNLVSETWNVLKQAAEKRDVLLSILGVSWFWFLGVVVLTQVVPFAHNDLHADEKAATTIMAVFSVATGLGSAFCNRLLKGRITLRFVPLAALLMSLFMFDLYVAASNFGAGFVDETATPWALFDRLTGLRLVFDLFMVAFCSGLFVVPLFAFMQSRTPFYRRARIIGANNILNAVYMVVATILCGVLLKMGFTVKGLYALCGFANLVVVGYLVITLPQTLFATVARFLMRLFYRVEVNGMEHYLAAGNKALIVPNHTSYLDGPLLSCFLPERAAFAADTRMAKGWWSKPAFFLYDMVPIDPLNPLSLRELVNRLKRHQKVVIFPEGRLTTTGGLMKIYEGPAALANLAGAKVLPLRIDGALYSPFSRMRGKLKLRLFPKITLTFQPPVEFTTPKGLAGSALREWQAEQLYSVMAQMIFKTSNIDRTLWDSLLDAAQTHGKGRQIIEDIQRVPVTYGRLIMGSMVLGRKIAQLSGTQRNVGVLLPNANAVALSFFGLMAHGKVPAMLNFSTGAINMAAACVAAQVNTIITSRRFIETAEMQGDIEVLSKKNKIVYLEDVRGTIGTGDKIYGLACKFFPRLMSSRSGAVKDPNSPAVVLFTSGSEGLPKGVVLSHRNLNANWQQAAARIAFSPDDTIFNALPVFHAFGLLGGLLLPLLAGVRTFLYPSPLHYKIIPELCYDTNATVIFGTDTFLTGYARSAHPYDFFNIRLVVAGAERLKPDTRALWMEKFGLRILEGYGVTECSPVLAVNTPLHYRSGSVGQLLDDIQYRLDPVEGINQGGRLHVKGPNIMMGYLRADTPGVIEAPPGGWHDTGDIVDVDELKYITILGRAKRFSKIAGEMVSLTAIEQKLQVLYPDAPQAVVAVPDKKKGEQLVLFTTVAKVDRKTLSDGLKREGATDLMVPKTIVHVEALPLLGSGKTDYVSLNRMGLEQVGG
ncbi:acyl-[ACP]--phospholipid O-acyltransferase [Aestuariivirga litoralis]|uniref:acyl-[ACP]--phospholipid O-acyltransferase n=1 Tax=Aestuariivirga litoralis TaxID=2650924 RepID=UPI0018C480DA|nr:acyl-[ACP]--phospholipid O-acyltransferase [Aestuariivirga litoralis]MBG1232828.1 acyl-[ACP]--phospholipid O-acyltransferase [Aestuariivirga litoralis]